MIHELTKNQQEIVDYSDEHGIEETMTYFSISYTAVSYLRNKRKRLLNQQEFDCKNEFVEIPLNDCQKTVSKNEDSEIEFVINGAKIKMRVNDFRRAFSND